jgi:siroheme synthase-like protein
MSALFPVMLDLRGWPCAVLGGGAMAEEKVRNLLAAEAQITLIAETVIAPLEELAALGRIAWRAERPCKEHLAQFRLAISALGGGGINAELAAEAERLGVLFNAADDPAHCRFLLPSVHRQGDLVIAVSTAGKCPALAVRLRERFQREFGPHYGQFLSLCGSFREQIARVFPEFGARRRLWYRLVDSPALALLRDGRPQEARAALEGLIEGARKEQAA